jgi:DNA-binding transcriptional regulator LsrR (DeoR family)
MSNQVNNRIGEEERFQVQVAWMYHVERMTQGAIAEHLGVTRLRVNRALGEAGRNGIVRIQITSPHAPCMELENRFKKDYGLQDVSIVPKAADDAHINRIVGTELSRYLSTLLAQPKIKLFGIAWGSSLYYATLSVVPTERKDLEIVSIMGGLPQGSEINSFEIATRLSHLYSAKRLYFTAPLYASTEQSRDTIMVQDVFQEVLTKIRRADATVVGVGDTSRLSLLIRDGLPKDISPESLIAAGAVGDILGYFLNKDGAYIDHPINRRVIGLNPLEMRSMPNVILTAGGQHKVPVISAVLKMGLIDVLVTDQRTAEGILALDAKA